MHDHDTRPEVSVGSRVNPFDRATAIAGADPSIAEANVAIGEEAAVGISLRPEPEPMEAITVPPEPRSS